MCSAFRRSLSFSGSKQRCCSRQQKGQNCQFFMCCLLFWFLSIPSSLFFEMLQNLSSWQEMPVYKRHLVESTVFFVVRKVLNSKKVILPHYFFWLAKVDLNSENLYHYFFQIYTFFELENARSWLYPSRWCLVYCRCYLLIANFQHCKNGILDEELPSFSAGARKMCRYNQARVFGYLSCTASSRILQNAKKGDLPQPT